MTIEELIDTFIEPEMQEFEVYDTEKNDTVFCGTFLDCPDELREADISTIDNIGQTSPRLVINV